MANEELKQALGDDLCDYCPWKSGEIDHRCDSLCEGLYCDDALDAFLDENQGFFDDDVLIGELAKIICQNGVQTGEKRLFQWMRDNGYLCQHGERYNQPTQKAMEMGLFEIKKTTIQKPNGDTLITNTTKVTGKGQVYFVNKFLHNNQKNLQP